MTQSPSLRPYLGVVAAAMLLLAGGVAYRALAAYIGAELASPIRLDPPLATLPLAIGNWIGEDVPLREGVLRIAGNDDYVSRSYRHAETGAVVSLYIGYTARPRTMLRHRPSVCYPSAGWTPLAVEDDELALPIPTQTPLPARSPRATRCGEEGLGEGRGIVHHRGTETQRETAASEGVPRNPPPTQVAADDSLWRGKVGGGSEPSHVPTPTPFPARSPRATRCGEEELGEGVSVPTFPPSHVPTSAQPRVPTSLPVRLHGFLRPGVPEQRVVVLNYYVLNGVPTLDEYSFWGLSWRDPNRDRDASRYVAQVQIAAAVRTTPDAAADLVRRFAADSAPAILPLLPAAAGPDVAAPGATP